MLEENAIILSIKPKYANLILSGNKKYEFRKSIWRSQKNIEKVYIYASSPVKKIIGYFTIKRIFCGSPDNLWDFFKSGSGLSKNDFFNYFNGKEGYALEIDKIEKFIGPLDPKKYDPNFNAPQNFAYLASYNKKLIDKLFLSSIIDSFEDMIIRLIKLAKKQEMRKKR